jgi:acyl-CoA synthetase (AMP-forming)/AMP-acid ligase II
MRHPRHAQSQARGTDLRKRLAVSRLRACAAGRSVRPYCTAADIGAAADTLAPALRQRLGDEPFVLLAENSLPSAALIAAAARERSSCVLLPRSLRAQALDVAARTGAVAVVAAEPGTGSAGTPAEASPTLVVRATREPPCAAEWARLGGRVPDLDSGTGRGAVVLLTSGSGPGGPKLPVYTWDACRAQAAETVRRLKLSSADRFVCASSIAHAYNFNGLLSALEAGADIGLAPDAATLRALLEDPGGGSDASNASDVRRTVLFATPRMYADLVDAFDSTIASSGPAAGGRSVRSHAWDRTLPHAPPLADGLAVEAYSAGCPLPAAVRRRARAVLGSPVRQNYGMSETGNIALWAREDHDERAAALGAAALGAAARDFSLAGAPWADVRVDPGGSRGGRLGNVPKGAGEVVVRAPWQSLGYVERGPGAGDAARVRPHAGGEVRTGDLGLLRGGDDASGSAPADLWIGRRIRAVVGGAGTDWLPHEAEAALRACPGVRDAAVCDLGGGRIGVMVAAPGDETAGRDDAPAAPDAAAVARWCADALPDRFRALASAEVAVVQALPTSPAGKILLSKVVEALRGG